MGQKDYEIIYQEPPLQDFEASEVSLYVQSLRKKLKYGLQIIVRSITIEFKLLLEARILLRDWADVITADLIVTF